MDRTSLRESIVAGRLRLDRALADFDDRTMLDVVDDDWTRKDVLAHIEAWERRVVTLLEALRAGAPFDAVSDTDELNARFRAESQDRPIADVRRGEREAYETMLAAIDGATDEELFDGRHFARTEGDAFADWFRGNGDAHYDEHLEQLTRPAR